MYLDYEEYQNLGGTLDETTFTRFEVEASSRVDYATFNRLVDEDYIPEKVKFLVYKLVELLQRQADSLILGKTLNGESNAYIIKQANDGVTTEYNGMDAAALYSSIKEDVNNAIKFYLNGVKNSKGYILTYRGIYPDE